MYFLLKIKWLLLNYLLSKPRSFYCHSIIQYLYDKQLTADIYNNPLLPNFSVNKRTLFFTQNNYSVSKNSVALFSQHTCFKCEILFRDAPSKASTRCHHCKKKQTPHVAEYEILFML